MVRLVDPLEEVEERKSGSGKLALSQLAGRHRLRLFPPAEPPPPEPKKSPRKSPARKKVEAARKALDGKTSLARLATSHKSILMKFVEKVRQWQCRWAERYPVRLWGQECLCYAEG